jgi:hypothetical protein
VDVPEDALAVGLRSEGRHFRVLESGEELIVLLDDRCAMGLVEK